MVSLICSLSAGFGSGVVAGDTGVLLNNRAGDCFSLDEGHPNVYAPGKKTMHTLNCYLVADPDGTPVLVGGTPGGDSQPQWNVQVLSAMIDGEFDVQAAIETPRWVVWPGTYPADVGNPFELRVEDRLGEETIATLERRGHRVKRLGPWGAGRAHQAIARDPATGVLAAGSDPRGEGIALGF
jgi:gamma-glutamyltranspeptidase/glutathione hydrolase